MNAKNKVPKDCLALVTKILWALERRKMHVYMLLQNLLEERLELTFPIGYLSSKMMSHFFSHSITFKLFMLRKDTLKKYPGRSTPLHGK